MTTLDPYLSDLYPSFVDHGGYNRPDGSYSPKRNGIGIIFECPCGCGVAHYIPFKNPLDGGSPISEKGWQRTGETFETLTLSPSIRRTGGCKWHGWIRDGRVITC